MQRQNKQFGLPIYSKHIFCSNQMISNKNHNISLPPNNKMNDSNFRNTCLWKVYYMFVWVCVSGVKIISSSFRCECECLAVKKFTMNLSIISRLVGVNYTYVWINVGSEQRQFYSWKCGRKHVLVRDFSVYFWFFELVFRCVYLRSFTRIHKGSILLTAEFLKTRCWKEEV